MKLAALCLSLVVCVALAGSMLLAQETPREDGQKVAKEGKQAKAEGVKLSDEEMQAKVAAKKEAAKLGDIGVKMNKVVAFSDEQKARIAELNKKREAALKELNDKFVKDALALMTEDQRTAWQQASKEGVKKDGQPKDGQPKDGQVKEGKVKDGQPKEFQVKEGKIKVDKGGIPQEGGDAP